MILLHSRIENSFGKQIVTYNNILDRILRWHLTAAADQVMTNVAGSNDSSLAERPESDGLYELAISRLLSISKHRNKPEPNIISSGNGVKVCLTHR